MAIQNINGRLVRIKQEALTKLQAQRQKEKKAQYNQRLAQYNQRLDNIAKELATQIREYKFSSVSEFKQFYNSLPNELKKRLSIPSDYAEKLRNKAINRLKSRIEWANKRIEYYKKKGRDDMIEKRLAEKRVYDQELNKALKNNDIIPDIDYIKRLASAKGSEAYKHEKAKIEAKNKAKELEDIIKKGNVKTIKYEAKTGLPTFITTKDGKTYDLSNYSKKTRQALDVFTEKSRIAKQEKLANDMVKTYNSELNKVLSGNRPNINLLKQGKLTPDLYTSLVRAYETKVNPVKLTTDQSMKALGLTSKKVGADDWTREVAYKTLVNLNAKEMNKIDPNIKPLSFKADISKFKKLANKINKKIEEGKLEIEEGKLEIQRIQKKTKEDVIKELKAKSLSIEEKVRTGQSVTPQQYQEYLNIIDKRVNELPKKQLKTAKIILLNTPKILSKVTGIVERAVVITAKDLKELFLSIYGVKGITGDKDGLVAKATRRVLTYEIEAIKNKGKSKTFEKDVKTITNFAEKSKDKVIETAEFVKQHPVESAVLTAVAGKNFGRGIINAIKKNPEEAAAQVLSFFVPGTIIRYGTKGYVAIRNSKQMMKFFSKLQKINPKADFVIKYAGKGSEIHKGVFDQYLVEFKGDIITKSGQKLGVIRVQAPTWKKPFSWIDKIKGRKPGQFKRVYKISSKEILIRNTPSEFADVITELRKAGKIEDIAHVTPDAKFLKKALKSGKPFEVKYPTDVPFLKGRLKAGGIELGMFYAPTTAKPIYLPELKKIVPKGTPQVYSFYANLQEASLSDLLRGKAIFKAAKDRGIFIKTQKIDSIPLKQLKKDYKELAQILGNDVGKTKLSASTLKRIRTELEVIDSPFTKNLPTKRFSIKLPNGEKFTVYTGKTVKLTEKELKQQITKYINAKFERINNAIKFAAKNPKKTKEAEVLIKQELKSIQYLSKKLDASKAKIIINKVEKYKNALNLKNLNLTKAEKSLYNSMLKKISSLEKEYLSKGLKVYTLSSAIKDLAKASYVIKKAIDLKSANSVKKKSSKTIKKPSKSSKIKKIKKPSKSSKIKKVSKPSVTAKSKQKSKSSKKISVKPSKPAKTSKPKKTSKAKPSVSPKPSGASKSAKSSKTSTDKQKNKKRIKLSTSKHNKKIKQLVYDIRYRERKNKSLPYHPKKNPVIVKVKRFGLPLNSAFMTAAKIVDNSLVRSFELIPAGEKVIKDRKINNNLLKKFTLRKSKKVLKFVEKKKYARDTRGEKKELQKVKRNKKKS